MTVADPPHTRSLVTVDWAREHLHDPAVRFIEAGDGSAS